MSGKHVLIVGGGIAGMQAAVSLAEAGVRATILERGPRLGGKLNEWHKLFPSFTPAAEVLDPLAEKVVASGVEVLLHADVERVEDKAAVLADGRRLEGDAVILCPGFDVFDAHIKEEYGYGIYRNVLTTVDLERMFNEGRVLTAAGEKPRSVAILHCVGSRDEKVNQRHCSRVCCITAVKQAIELKDMFPDAEVYDFYMDIRMFGPGYEELYRRAQQDYNIHFIRGRISEAAQAFDGGVQIKAEDTLVGRPLRLKVDMLVLAVGMTSTRSHARFALNPAVDQYESGFLRPRDLFSGSVDSSSPSIFYAGTVTAPKNVGESLAEASLAAQRACQYLNS